MGNCSAYVSHYLTGGKREIIKREKSSAHVGHLLMQG